MRATLASGVFFLAAWQSAGACSPAPQNAGVPDRFVFYGEVVEHVEAPYLSGSTWGIRVVPRHAFRIAEPTADGSYTIYPMRTAADCRPVPVSTPDGLRETFRLGSIVGVVGRAPSRSPIPGDIGGTLFTVDWRCDVAELARREHDYAELHGPCGRDGFEANKDAVRLETASPSERGAILERLARYRGRIAYLDLLAQHAPSVAIGRDLRDRRYGDFVGSCLATEQELESFDWELRSRRDEYCTQDDPYDAWPPDEWSLYDAITRNRIAVVDEFLRRGGDPNEPLRGTPMGWVHPLKVALYGGHESIALALLRAGADFERSGTEPVVLSSTGMADVLGFLLTQDPERVGGAIDTIDAACSGAHYDVVDVVTRHARERGLPVADSDTLASCIMNSPDSARLLLARGVPATRMALAAAALYGSVGMVRLLLAHGADPAEPFPWNGRVDSDIVGWTAIDFALREYEFKDEPARRRVHHILHEIGSEPPPKSGVRVDGLARDARADLEAHPQADARLAFAASIGLYDAVEELLAEDADAFTPNALRLAMQAALEGRHPDVVRLLLASGAPAGGGALHTAAGTGPAGIVEHLIALGANVDERIDGVTPLEIWLRSARRDPDVLQALLMAGANVCDVVAKLEPDASSRAAALRAADDCAP